MGRFQEALDHASEAARLYDPDVHRSSAVQYGHDIGVAALAHLALARWCVGDAAGFESASAQSITLASKIGHANTLGYAGMWSTFARLLAGEAAEAERSASHLIKFSAEQGMVFWSALGQCMRGGALIDLGRAADGLVAVEAGMNALERAQEGMFRSAFLCVRAKGLLQVGHCDEALATADEALQVSHTNQERWWEPEVLRVRAEVMLASGPAAQDRAANELQTAMDVAGRQGSRFLHLRAATTLAMLRRDQGRVAEAQSLLAPAYSWFTDRSNTPDLKNAEALLEELGTTKNIVESFP
jgi:predicted ATPase